MLKEMIGIKTREKYESGKPPKYFFLCEIVRNM
jgi:hypothetical protein